MSDRPIDHDAGLAAELEDGSMRAVEIDGEAVLLVRVGGACHAVGGTCPHARAPLAEGTLHGTTVVCPWHKAAFDVTTGAHLEPPAVDDLPRYAVREAAGRLLVRTVPPSPAPPSALAAAAPDARCMLLVGAGAAGAVAAQTLRDSGFMGRVVLVGQEDELPYDRTVLSKYALSGQKGGEKTPLQDAAFYERHKIERVVGTVTAIETAARVATFEDGRTIEYDAALLAPGGTARTLDVPGAQLEHVFTVRTKADAEAVVAAAKTARTAVVVGGGFISMEAAASLAERGLHVTVVAPQVAPFADKLGVEIGTAVQRLHERHGIQFRTGEEVAGIEPGRVQLRGGDVLAADLVVAGLGIAPSTGMLHHGAVREDGGVDVNERLQAADGLFAAGDVAAFPWQGGRIRVEHWRVAQQHGRVAARNMLGHAVAYDAVPYLWTIHFKKRLDYVGHAETWDELVIDGELATPEFVAFYLQAGRVAAVAGWGRDTAMAQALHHMTVRRDWTLDAMRAAMAG